MTFYEEFTSESGKFVGGKGTLLKNDQEDGLSARHNSDKNRLDPRRMVVKNGEK